MTLLRILLLLLRPRARARQRRGVGRHLREFSPEKNPRFLLATSSLISFSSKSCFTCVSPFSCACETIHGIYIFSFFKLKRLKIIKSVYSVTLKTFIIYYEERFATRNKGKEGKRDKFFGDILKERILRIKREQMTHSKFSGPSTILSNIG